MYEKRTFLITSAIFLFLFIVVALLTSGTTGLLIDEKFAYEAQHVSSMMENVMGYVSYVGSSEVILIITILIGLVFLIKRQWQPFFFFFVVSVGGVILNLVLKLLVQRARPGDEAKLIEVFNFQVELQSYSFPSGHTMRATILFAFIVYLLIYYLRHRAWKIGGTIFFIILLLGVAWSRVVLDAHFVTDIVGGVLISISWFFLCLAFFYKPKSGRRISYTYLHR